MGIGDMESEYPQIQKSRPKKKKNDLRKYGQFYHVSSDEQSFVTINEFISKLRFSFKLAILLYIICNFDFQRTLDISKK